MEKKLYKVEKGKMLDGVCAGIAEYFNIDATIIRIVWAILVACGGSGILAYIICAIIMPRKPDNYVEAE